MKNGDFVHVAAKVAVRAGISAGFQQHDREAFFREVCGQRPATRA